MYYYQIPMNWLRTDYIRLAIVVIDGSSKFVAEHTLAIASIITVYLFRISYSVVVVVSCTQPQSSNSRFGYQQRDSCTLLVKALPSHNTAIAIATTAAAHTFAPFS